MHFIRFRKQNLKNAKETKGKQKNWFIVKTENRN